MYYLMNEGSMADRRGYSDPQVPKKKPQTQARAKFSQTQNKNARKHH